VNSFAFETWDGGRLRVNLDHADLLCRHKLTTFSSLYHYTGGVVARDLAREHGAMQIELEDAGLAQSFCLKRHARQRWHAYWTPFLQLRWPILGARQEWDSILQRHASGVGVAIPVALGEHDGQSFLLTAASAGCARLSQPLAEVRTH
jgi:hypothetical protein